MDNLPVSLQEKLDDYNLKFEALNSLLGDAKTLGDGVASDLQVEQTKEMLKAALPVGVGTLVELASHAISEGVRLKAAQYLIDRALGKDGSLANEDEATKLLKRLIVEKEV